jgi:muconolactone D-isomerase
MPTGMERRRAQIACQQVQSLLWQAAPSNDRYLAYGERCHGPRFGDVGSSCLEFPVTMTTHVPAGTTDEAVDEVRGREAARSRELAAGGNLRRLWRPPLNPGEWRTLGLFAAGDADELERLLA